MKQNTITDPDQEFVIRIRERGSNTMSESQDDIVRREPR